MSPLTATLRDDYLAALLAGDGTNARHLIEEAASAGDADVPALYLEVLQPAMYELGAMWERGEVSVAYEHYATAVTQSVLATLAPRMRVPPSGGRLAIVVCSPGEQHLLGVQMVGDFLEAEGWEVLQLGASLPAEELAALAAAEQPDIVGLSSSTAAMLPGALNALRALGELEERPFVVVGGQAWQDVTAERIAEHGADAIARDPRELLALLREEFPPVPEESEA